VNAQEFRAMTESVKHVEVLQAMRSVFANIPAPCHERDALDAAIERLQREAAGDGEVQLPPMPEPALMTHLGKLGYSPTQLRAYAVTAIAMNTTPASAEPVEDDRLTVDVRLYSAEEACSLGRADFANLLRYRAEQEHAGSSYGTLFNEAARRIASHPNARGGGEAEPINIEQLANAVHCVVMPYMVSTVSPKAMQEVLVYRIREFLAPHPTPAALDAEDAARYRWLRQFDIGIDHQGYDNYRWYAYAKPEPKHGRFGLDAVIDAARATTGAE
jgi:hypothetical protein